MRVTWKYLAGFTDGEGCIGVCGRGPRITWGQTDRRVLDAIQEFLERQGFFCCAYVIQARLPRRPNPIHMLNVNRRADCRRLIKILRPLLIVKVESCDRVLQWLSENPSKNYMGELGKVSTKIRQLAKAGYALGTIANKVKCGRSKLTQFCQEKNIMVLRGGVYENGKRLPTLPRKKPCLGCPTLIKRQSDRCKPCSAIERERLKRAV